MSRLRRGDYVLQPGHKSFELAVLRFLEAARDGDFSVRLPDASDRFLINPQGLHWSEITAAPAASAMRAPSAIQRGSQPASCTT